MLQLSQLLPSQKDNCYQLILSAVYYITFFFSLIYNRIDLHCIFSSNWISTSEFNYSIKWVNAANLVVSNQVLDFDYQDLCAQKLIEPQLMTNSFLCSLILNCISFYWQQQWVCWKMSIVQCEFFTCNKMRDSLATILRSKLYCERFVFVLFHTRESERLHELSIALFEMEWLDFVWLTM